MFDTIVMKASYVLIANEYWNNLKPVIKTFLDEETGLCRRSFVLHDEKIPYINYQEWSQSLIVQVSIPKFLYGNNVRLLQEKDISVFFQCLHERLFELFGVTLRAEDWYLYHNRLDVCWNFTVGGQIDDYLNRLSRLHLSFKKTVVTGDLETVAYKNKSSQIIFYNKQKEVIHSRESKEVIGQADGLLRMEIRPSHHDWIKFSKRKRVIDLLKVDVFTEITRKVMNQLIFPNEPGGISPAWLRSQPSKISQIETLLGFQLLQQEVPEGVLKQFYTAATYVNRKNLVKGIPLPKKQAKLELHIDYANLG
ncbi:hypothetical protein P4H65_20435 [Paenibacillus chitinolyticus]|uniref:hypothetical protein n=1 Tax=Paenibacillus chitinolyticus TaxID=79263 RepID=UPI002DBB5E06|nr:hypothetical protein [Paenibacillus chitinolyticus]MEC0248168.1 hypothetical protein [Paenibacillus chitinolyticus]